MGRFASTALSLILLAAMGGAGALYVGKQKFEGAGPLAEPIELVVPRNSGLNAIADRLEAAGAIDDSLIFRLGTRIEKAERDLKAGEYAIPARASMADIVDLLRSGDVIQRKITVAEGLTVFEVAEIVAAAPALDGPIGSLPPEGSLAPETYFYQRGEAREDVIARMRAAQQANLDALWPNRAENLPIKTKDEALILASIVEKETAVASERGLVAGVFINRLRKGMRLQSDPTVIYGQTGGRGPLGRSITRSDLRDRNAYNTYVIPALPPSPIANPGRDSIAAVLNPEATKYIYFVADGTGGHAFAETLAQHNRNVAEWRKIERQRAAE